MSEHTIYFTLSSILTIDTFQREEEVAPERYRATYNLFPNGQVMVLRVELNDARAGKPDYWVPDSIGRRATQQLARWIEDDTRERTSVGLFEDVA